MYDFCVYIYKSTPPTFPRHPVSPLCSNKLLLLLPLWTPHELAAPELDGASPQAFPHPCFSRALDLSSVCIKIK